MSHCRSDLKTPLGENPDSKHLTMFLLCLIHWVGLLTGGQPPPHGCGALVRPARAGVRSPSGLGRGGWTKWRWARRDGGGAPNAAPTTGGVLRRGGGVAGRARSRLGITHSSSPPPSDSKGDQPGRGGQEPGGAKRGRSPVVIGPVPRQCHAQGSSHATPCASVSVGTSIFSTSFLITDSGTSRERSLFCRSTVAIGGSMYTISTRAS